jgi:hypothetical protein
MVFPVDNVIGANHDHAVVDRHEPSRDPVFPVFLGCA